MMSSEGKEFLSCRARRVLSAGILLCLVGGRRVADLLTWARATFDRVIIDALPLGLVSDTLSLARLPDCVRVMARPVTSRKRAVRHTIHRFHEVGISNISVVMNDVDHSKFAYYGYGPYYHCRKHYGSYLEAPPVGATQEPPPQKENS